MTDLAVPRLETYLKDFPEFQEAKKLLDGLKTGQVSIVNAPSAK